ncbi:MAG TPA: DUF962 domain-containing protein [Pyrinomonadaceae bacterium]|nr:DUF962 domain-containing protein [Pyrinomonadaceae bacterium]
MTARAYKSFEEFWPFYVSEHRKPETRLLHALGTTVGMACALGLLLTGRWRLLPLALIPGYGAAWFSHFVIEKNRPATFQYPLWSFMGDYKMLVLMLSGKMDAEVKRLNGPRES